MRLLLVTGLWIALVAAGGCSSVSVTEPTLLLDTQGPIAVDVECFAGDVEIKAGPKVTVPSVSVQLEATHGYLRRDEAEMSLSQIGYQVDLVGGELSPTLQVRCGTSHAEPHFQRAHLTIEVQQIEDVRVRTRHGDVTVLGVGGPIDIDTDNGHVLLATPLPQRDGIRIANRNGDIDVRLVAASEGELELDATRGRVLHRITFGQTVVHEGTDHDTLRATFNDGSSPIVLRTEDGEVRFSVVEQPLVFGLLRVE